VLLLLVMMMMMLMVLVVVVVLVLILAPEGVVGYGIRGVRLFTPRAIRVPLAAVALGRVWVR
jgi:hypothetical protein